MSICGEIANLAGENQSLRARIAELEELKDAHWAEACAAKADIDWVVNNYGWAERGGENVKETVTRLVEQRDAAKAEAEKYRAGEARAVEALKGIAEKARWILLDQCVKRGHDPRSAIGDWSLNVGDYLRDEIEGMAFMLDSQPALSWLAQREREVAAEELEKAHKDICQFAVQHEYGTGEVWTWSDAATYCFDRAAALRAGKEVGDVE